MSPTYQQNKIHIYKWIENNKKQHNSNKLKSYYKMKIKDPVWREIKYEFLSILL